MSILLLFASMLCSKAELAKNFDRTIPGEQRLFLSPSGYAMSLQRSGGLAPIAQPSKAARFTTSGEVVLAGLRPWNSVDSTWAAPIVKNGQVVLRVMSYGKSTGFFGGGDNMWLGTAGSVTHPTWLGDSLYLLKGGRLQEIFRSSGWFQNNDLNGPWIGLQGWRQSKRWMAIVWDANQVKAWIPSAGATSTSRDSLLKSSVTGTTSAGLWKDGSTWRLVRSYGANKIEWGNGATDSIPGPTGKLLQDASDSAVLFWQPTTGDLWRLRPGKRARIVMNASGMVPAGGANPTWIAFGGNIASGINLKSSGIVHLGDFHQPSGAGIASLRVDPEIWSPVVTPLLKGTASLLGEGDLNWTMVVRGPNGFSSSVATGTNSSTGFISRMWDGNGASNGKYRLVLQASRPGDTALDSSSFEIDKTAPATVSSWTGSGPIGPGRPWTWNLSGVVDDLDTNRKVAIELLLQNVKTGRVLSLNLDPRKIPGRKWVFDGRDAGGSWLPEGDWRLSWIATDTAGNRSDTMRGTGLSDSLLRIRRSGPTVVAKFAPISIPSGEPVEGWLQLEIAGSPNAVVQIGISDPLGVKADTLSVTLDVSGKHVAKRLLRTSPLSSGEKSWKIRAYESGWMSTANAVFFVGKIGPSITSPIESERVFASGSREVRGIAPDPDPAGASDAIYRVALHKGQWVPAVNPKWDDLGRSGAQLLPVTSGAVASSGVNSRNRSAFDLKGIPGSIGQANRLASEEALAVLDASKLDDSVYTLSLWTGKGDSIKVATRKILVSRTKDSASTSLDLSLLRPSFPIIDRTDADTLNDLIKIAASIDSVPGMEVEWQVWVLESNGTPTLVWSRSNPMVAGRDTLVFGGRKSDKSWINGEMTIVAIARAGLSRFESRISGEVIPPPTSAADSTLQLEPDTLDLGLSELGWKLPSVKCQVNLASPEQVRIVVRDSLGNFVKAVSGTKEVHQFVTWDGFDTSGIRRIDPNGSDRRFTFDLEVMRGDSWIQLDRDTLFIVNQPATLLQDTGIFVQGRDVDSSRIADLISDLRIRAKLEGPLSYYPDADVRFRILPEGFQSAREFLGVDYQVEWAKAYNSFAGYQNYSGTWNAKAFVGSLWWKKTRTTTIKPSASSVPFWFFAHPGMTGIGTRATDLILAPDSLGSFLKTDKVGTPLVFRPYEQSEILQFEVDGRLYTYDAAKFFGDGKNHAFLRNKANDLFYTSNIGYSGFLDGSPIHRSMQGLSERFKSLKSMPADFCVDQAQHEPVPLWKFSELNVAAWEDSLLSGMLLRTQPERRRQLDSLVNLGFYCQRATGDNVDIREPRSKAVIRSIWDSALSAEHSRLYDSVKLIADEWVRDGHSVPEEIDSILGMDRSRMQVSSLQMLSYMRMIDSFSVDSIDFQVFLDSAAARAAASPWYSDLNTSSNFKLHRNYQSWWDDAHFHPTPVEWNQKFYVLPPGYTSLKADTIGGLLYATQSLSSTTLFEGSDAAHGDVYFRASEGDDRVIPGNPPTNIRKWMQRPADNHWFFTMSNEFFSDDNKGYEFADMNKHIGWSRGALHDVASWSGIIPNLGLQNTWAYSVPPRINWMNPWFYLNDSTVTVVKRKLYADSGLYEPIEDGLRWSVNSSGKSIQGQTTFGGYKSGQISWWYRPSRLEWSEIKDSAYVENGRVVPRQWPINRWGDTLSEVDYISNWGTHGGPDPRNPKAWSNHDLIFQPKLKIDERTFGVVWDTTQVAWPNYALNMTRAHLDLASLRDVRLELDSLSTGRSWVQHREVLSADSLWVPGMSVPKDSLTILVRDLFPGLPDERWAGSVAGRSSHRLYSFVKAATLKWNIQPLDSLGRLLESQTAVQWRLDTTQRDTLRWTSVWTGRDTSLVVAKPRLIAKYGYVPSRMELWSSESDPLLKSRGGWVHLNQSFGNTSKGFEPWRSGITLMPLVVDSSTRAAIPCYSPKVAAAFVRERDAGSGTCSDRIVLNPNLLATTGDKARWTVELFYPDGQTPNRDFVQRGTPSLEDVALGLSTSQSSQRWVRLAGGLPTRLVSKNGNELEVVSWKLFGVQDTEWVRLAPPKSLTDSIDLWTAIRRPGDREDFWTTDSQSDVGWWNITGRHGTGSFVVRVTGKDAVTGAIENIWIRKDFTIGTPRGKDTLTLSDAYHRAELAIPADGSNADTRPVVLHTLAGADLDGLAIPGLKPVGPVISLSPSGMAFPKPASLRYTLTLREVLSRMGNSIPDTAMQIPLAQMQACTTWARQNLSVWVLSDSRKMEKVPTAIQLDRTTNASTASLDFDRIVLVGLVPHFSKAMVLDGDLSRNLAPRWVSARVVNGRLELSLDGRSRRQLVDWSLPQIEIRLQPTGVSDTVPASPTRWYLNSSFTGTYDSLLVIDSATAKAVSLGQVQLRARYVDAIASSVFQPNATDRAPVFDRFAFEPRRLGAGCSSNGAFTWRSDAAGSAVVRIVSPTGQLVDKFQTAVAAGENSHSWSPCLAGSALAKGIYRAEIRSVSQTGVVSGSPAKVLWIGVDTLAPLLVLQSLAPTTIGLTDTTQGLLRWNLLALGMGSRTLKIGATRINGFLENGVAQKWSGTSQVLTSDSVVVEGQWNGFADGAMAKSGDWIFNAQVDSIASESSSFRIVRDSLDVALSLSDTLLTLDESRVLGIRASVGKASKVSVWVKTASGRNIALLGSIGHADAKVTRLSSTWSISADTLGLGTTEVCLGAQGEFGGIRTLCRNVRVVDLGPGVRVTRATPTDSLWVGWPDGVFAKAPKRSDKVFLEGVSRRSGRILVWAVHKGRILFEETVSVPGGSFHWSWKPSADDPRIFQDFVEVKVSALGADGSILDTNLVTKPLIVTVPKALIWAGRKDPIYVRRIQDYLFVRGIDARVADTSMVLQFLDASRKGALVLLDSALPGAFWKGRDESPLFRWAQQGGNLVFAGAPAFSARMNGNGDVVKADTSDYLRARIYGLPPTAGTTRDQNAYLTFARGIRSAATRADSVDSWTVRAWPVAVRDSMRTPRKLSWFDSAGIAVDWGMLARKYDTTRNANGSVKRIDTVRVGDFLFFPASRDRDGTLLEIPDLRSATDADKAAAYVYNALFVPDQILRNEDVVVTATPRTKPRMGWKPIPGDTVDVKVSLRFRSGGVFDSLDSTKVKIGLPGCTDNEWTVRPLHAGTTLVGIYRCALSDTARYGIREGWVKVDSFRLPLSTGDTLIEPDLRNNTLRFKVDVGDTTRPKLRWLDSTVSTMQGLLLANPVRPGAEIGIAALAGSIHKQPNWISLWKASATKTGDALDRDSLVVTDAGDSVRLPWVADIPLLSEDRTVRWVRLTARDRYGNQDSLALGLEIDATLPEIVKLEGVAPDGSPVAPEMDTTMGDTVWVFHPTLTQLDPVSRRFKVRVRATDTRGLASIEAQVPGPETWAELKGQKDTTLVAAVTPVDVLSDSADFELKVVDLAGNFRKTRFRVLSDTKAPWLTVHQVRKPDQNGWFVWPTLIDSFQREFRGVPGGTDSVARKVAFLVYNGKRLMSPTSMDTSDPFHSRPRARELAYSGAGKEKLVTIAVGDTLDLDVGIQDDGYIVASRITLDGKPLDTSAYRDLDTLLRKHPTEKMLRFVATKRKQKLVVWGMDAVGNQDSLIVWFVDSLPDLQIVDPQNDHTTGQDVGEVYMRQTLVNKPDGSTTPRTHWLVHSWNPLGSDSSWAPPMRLYVDVDADSTTGDTTGVLRGADRALELISGNGSDTGRGAHIVPMAYENGLWIVVGDTLHEGGTAPNGVVHFGNHPDDPRTVPVGTGTQILPSRRQAGANLGAWEIGWDLFGSGDQLKSIRWGLVSSATGDTVIDTATHRLKVFEPYGFRPVTVDGDVSEWREQDFAQMRVWTGTSISGSQLRVKLSVANDTGVAVQGGFELRYYFKGVAGTVANIDPIGQVQAFAGKVTVSQPVRVPGGPRNTDSLLWAVTVKCEGCSFNSQGAPWGMGTLLLTGPSIKSITTSLDDDWSYLPDTARTLNPHVPAWLSGGSLVWGYTPPVRALKLPQVWIEDLDTGRWIPGNGRNARVGWVDPEQATDLVATWYLDGQAIPVAYNRIIQIPSRDSGVVHLRVAVDDPLEPGRIGYAEKFWRIQASGDTLVWTPLDSMWILENGATNWWISERWGDGMNTDTLPVPTLDSATNIQVDGICEGRLKPVRGDKLLRIPFSKRHMLGMRLDALQADVNMDRFTHLEFWVATSRNWTGGRHSREIPVRFWLTKQERPGSGDQNGKSEEDFQLLQAYLPSGRLSGRWQRVLVPLSELVQTPYHYSNSQDSLWFLKFMLEHPWSSNTEIDTARRSDLLLDGMRFVKLAPSNAIRTTRRTEAAMAGFALFERDNVTMYSWWLRARLLHSGSANLESDRLGIHTYYKDPKPSQDWDAIPRVTCNNVFGTDESVVYGPFCLTAQGELDGRVVPDLPDPFAGTWTSRFFWTGTDNLPTGKSVSLNLSVPLDNMPDYRDTTQVGLPYPGDETPYLLDQMKITLLDDQGVARRVWGRALPGEIQDTITYWTPIPLAMPRDTMAPASTWVAGTCDDTVVVPPIPPAYPDSNYSTRPGRVDDLNNTGRGAITLDSVWVGGKPAVHVVQNSPDFHLAASFVFDTVWANRSEFRVDVHLPSEYGLPGAWPGQFTIAFFDGYSWVNLAPQAVSMTDAVGRWRTLSFRYDPRWTQTGRRFDAMILFNGHLAGVSTGVVNLGAMGVYPAPATRDSQIVVPPPPPPPYLGVPLSSPSQISAPSGIVWTSETIAGRNALVATPLQGGGQMFDISIPWDTAWARRNAIEMDVMVENMAWTGPANLVAIQSESARWWDELGQVTLPTQGTWGRVRWPIVGSRYMPGYPVILRFYTQLNTSSGARIHVSRLTGEF